MYCLIQRVSHAKIEIEKRPFAEINKGLLVFLGFEKEDTLAVASGLIKRILNYRIFNDACNKMNLSLIATQGDLLLIPQFTLCAETSSGTRPGFSKAMPPIESAKLFDYSVKIAKNNFQKVSQGVFGADMQVTLCNDGPVTFLLHSK